MVTVYAILFDSGEIYIGMTDDLPRRIGEHARRQSPSTQRYQGEFRVIYTKDFPDYRTGRTHEKFLKSGAGRALLKSITT